MKPLLALLLVSWGYSTIAFSADSAEAPVASKALTGEGQSIVNNSKNLAQAITAADPTSAAKAHTLATDLSTYMDAQESCRSKESIAMTYCLEKSNPGIAKALPIIQTLVSGISASVSDSCSTLAKAMNIANEALLAYQATCAAAKGVCQYSCSGAVSKIKKAQTEFTALAKTATANCKAKNATNPAALAMCTTNIETPLKSMTASIEKETNVKQDSSVAQKNTTCANYATQLASAVVGSIGVIKTMSDANSCAEATTDATAAATTDVDCTLEANQTNVVCICKATPRAAGCTEGLDTTASAMAADSLRSASTGDYTPAATTSGGDLGLGTETSLGAADTSSSGSSGGVYGGGSSGGLGGSSGLSAATDGKNSAQQKSAGYNTSIYGGENSGGGGGGSSWGRDSNDSTLRQYLPGGSRDPNKAAAIAARAAVKKEVTSEGGKSNWEKIRERYRDQRSTLIND